MNMKSRKDLKKLGRKSLKKHYVIFVAACLIAAFLGSEFTTSLDFSSAQKREETVQEFEKNLQGDFSSAVKTEVNSSTTWDDVLRTIAENDTEAGREMSEQIEEDEIREAESGIGGGGIDIGSDSVTDGGHDGIFNDIVSVEEVYGYSAASAGMLFTVSRRFFSSSLR